MILIIGGGRRIGKALVNAYSKKFPVHFTYHSIKPVLKKGLEASQLNLKDTSDIKKFVSKFKKSSISTLIYVSSTFYEIDFGRTKESEWNDLLDVNLKGAYFLCEGLRGKFKKGANIQFFGDVLLEKYPARLLPYAAAKAGLSNLMKNLALEFAPDVRVNEIRLGYALPPEKTPRATQQMWQKKIPLRRFSGVEPIIQASFFLNDCDYLTGTRIDLDGGLSLCN